MKGLALIMAFVAVAAVVGFAATYNKVRTGGETVVAKTMFAKDESRLPQEGCLLGVRDFICEGK